MTPEHKPKKQQKSHWDEVFTKSGAFFGEEASQFGKASLNFFQENNVVSLLELGCGQGRDSFLFAQGGLNVTGLDYSKSAVAEVSDKAAKNGLSSRLRTQVQDLREPLPFDDESFDACYSHMLLCMELSTAEIAFILRETHRILKLGGLAVYSVRSSFDKHYRTGIHLDEDIYKIGDFVVHFFTEGKVGQLDKGYEILKIERMEEGSLPRDLFCVSMKKGSAPSTWDLDPCKETTMSDPLDKFQAFMDASLAPGALDHKTKQQVALGAALAAECDP
jgi:SAM-dependent methyltransferase